MANPTPADTTQMGNSTLYLDYESYDFEVTSWEDLDPKTFSEGLTDDDGKMKWFDKYINHKVKFFAYLNFFSKEPKISSILTDFKGKYSAALDGLREDEILKNFTGEKGYNSQENKFLAELTGETKEFYQFFKLHYDDFFNKVGNGFYVNVGDRMLIEKEVIRESNRSAKKITQWERSNDVYINRVIRAFPLLYRSPKHSNQLAIQYVCFIDGFIRNSIDFFANGKILRVYLPVLDPASLNIAATAKTHKAVTFTAKPGAMSDYLKNDYPSLHFDPEVKPFDSDLKLETVGTNKDLRGCSIY